MSLKVMVLESDPGAAAEVARELTDAGHLVLRCHDVGVAAFPCRGLLEQSECPVRSHPVDVAVTVRHGYRSAPTLLEDGVTCALMHRLPLVVAGPPVCDPYDEYETRVVDPAGDIVGACEDTVRSVLAHHSRIATDALRASRVPSEALTNAGVVVTRRTGWLLATVSGLVGAAPRQSDAALLRMLAKLREFDRSAKGIDVVVERQPSVDVIETRHSI